MDDAFQRRDDLRYKMTHRYLRGHGIEIGAGVSPQPLPEGATMEIFDLRNAEELARIFRTAAQQVPQVYSIGQIRERFPDGADFLIAHHVIEHCPNPIGTLIEWSSYVADDGVVVISLPAAEYCSDDGRLVAPADHVLDDFLFDRDRDSFESREHAYSCVAGWMNDQKWEEWLPLRKKEISEKAHSAAHDEKLDTHWHAYTLELFDKVFRFASYFSPRAFLPLAIGHADAEEPYKTAGDIFYVYRVLSADASHLDRSEEFRGLEASLERAKKKLQIGLARLNRAEAVLQSVTPELSAPLAEAPGLGRYTAIEKYCRALTDFDETGLKPAFEELQGEFGTFPPEPLRATLRSKVGHQIVRWQAKSLWWLMRAIRIRDHVLDRIHCTLGRQLEALLGYQAETHNAVRELRERITALEQRLPEKARTQADQPDATGHSPMRSR